MLTLHLSPLQLEGYYVREFHFAVSPGLEEQARLAMQPGLHLQGESLFEPDPLSVNVLSGGGPNAEDPTRWSAVIELKTQHKPETRFPYDFRIVMVGYFQVHIPPGDKPGDFEAALKTGATSILYSAAREFIAGVTARGPFPAVVLPSVIIREVPDSEAKQIPSKKATKPRSSFKKGTAKNRRKVK
jgi:preprotein translocase subunit SecB